MTKYQVISWDSVIIKHFNIKKAVPLLGLGKEWLCQFISSLDTHQCQLLPQGDILNFCTCTSWRERLLSAAL